jgi:hypothetical protein
LTDPWQALEFPRRLVDSELRDVILVLCVASFLIFSLLLIALIRGRNLKKRVDALQLSIQTLIKVEENRILKERRNQPKRGTPE